MTEREKQRQAAYNMAYQCGWTVRRFYYECEDGEIFESTAVSASAASKVLAEEKPAVKARLVAALNIQEAAIF